MSGKSKRLPRTIRPTPSQDNGKNAATDAKGRLPTSEEAHDMLRALYVSTQYAKDVPDSGPNIAMWHQGRFNIYQALNAYLDSLEGESASANADEKKPEEAAECSDEVPSSSQQPPS